MDKKYIDAISNFAKSLEALVDALNSNETDGKTGDIGTSKIGDISNSLTEINASITEIKNDTKEIKEQTSQTLKIAQELKSSNSEGGLFGGKDSGSKMKSITEGIGTILLIAGAVLAIGMAFKLVGGIDIGSVLTLSIAIVAIAYAFEKIATIDGLDMKTVLTTSFTLVAMSAALVLSSYMFSMIQPVGAMQFLTAIGIAITFGIISLSIGFMAKSVRDVSMKDLVFIPIVLILISAAIWISSEILSRVKPVGPEQLITSIGIAITFGIISLSIGFIAKSIGNMSMKDLVFIPIVLILISAAIWLSSELLSRVKPIDSGTLVNIALISFTLAVSSVVLSLAMWVINKILTPQTLLLGAIALLVISATIMASSHILSIGNYSTYPSFDWAKGVGLSLVVFTGTVGAIGAIIVASLGTGALAIAAGAAAVLVIATTIMATSHILDKGNYKNGPTEAWAAGIGNSIGAFAPVFEQINKSKVMSLFGGDAMTGDGYGDVMISIANSIIRVAEIFDNANQTWKNGPSETWSSSIGKAIAAFSPVYSAIQTSMGDIISELFFGTEKVSKGDKMGNAMVSIANGIVKVAEVFDLSKVDWNNAKGPTVKWATSTSLLIETFADVYKSLTSTLGVGGLTKSDVEDGTPVLIAMVKGINDIGKELDMVSVENIGNAVNNIENLANSYEKLANSIEKLGDGMSSLSNIGEINGGIVFTNEHKQIGDITNQSVIKSTPAKIKQVDKDKTENGKTLDDIYNQMEVMNSSLGTIASNTISFNDYIEELRAKNINVSIDS